MEKSPRKVKASFIILTILYIIILLLSGYFTYNNFNKLNNINKNTDNLKKELNDLKKEYETIKEKKDSIVKEKEDLTNLDKQISDTKDDVFKLAGELEKKIQNNESDAKIAYLTFDDGPYYLTDSVLALLKEYKVKATFFTIGIGKEKCFDKKSVSCLDTYKRILDNGHTLANHTYSHSIFNGLYSSTNAFAEQVKKQEELIYEKTGFKTNILRFPGGSVTAGKLKSSIAEWLKENGYGWVDWTAEDGDGRELSSKEQAWRILKSSINDNIEVILLHDYNDITYSILPDVIKYLEEEGYILLPLFYDSVMINK